MDHPFRSAMFGGFNRQDVLEYLENSAQQAAQQQQELQAQLDQARQELTDRQSQESDGQEQLEKAQQEAEALQSQLDQANADLTISRETVSRLSEELEQARQELQTWKDKAAALEPDAQAYAALKERAAGLELDAHRRAQLVQDQAEGQVRQLHEQMAQWSNQVRLEYEALRAEVESTVTHAARGRTEPFSVRPLFFCIFHRFFGYISPDALRFSLWALIIRPQIDLSILLNDDRGALLWI